VVTAVTAQNSLGVQAVQPVDPEIVTSQIDALMSDFEVSAVKIGMLSTGPIATVVADCLARHAPRQIVFDPVMLAGSGDPLIEPPAVSVMLERLLPLATLLTPNWPEALQLLSPDPPDDAEDATRRLIALGPGAVLLKGGHLPGETLTDLLRTAAETTAFSHARQQTRHTHGTGCTLSAAITAYLAQGRALKDAVGGAVHFVQQAMRAAYAVGEGPGPLNHFWKLDLEIDS